MFSRILSGVRTLVSVPAGMTRMNFGLFFGASFGGTYLWNTLLVAAGYLLGFNVTFVGVLIVHLDVSLKTQVVDGASLELFEFFQGIGLVREQVQT